MISLEAGSRAKVGVICTCSAEVYSPMTTALSVAAEQCSHSVWLPFPRSVVSCPVVAQSDWGFYGEHQDQF